MLKLRSVLRIYSSNNAAIFICTVHVPPQVVVSPSNQTVVERETLLLACLVYGIPPPTVMWTEGSFDVMNASETTVYSKLFEEGVYTFVKSTLEICDADIRDVAEYSCTADNGVRDSDTAAFSVTFGNEGDE